MGSGRPGAAATARHIDDWRDAQAFAAEVVEDQPAGPDAHHHRLLARRLVAAAVWHASRHGSVPADPAELRRAVDAELSVDPDDLARRPLSSSPDRRVREIVGQVRRQGRTWVRVDANEQNAAAWIAMRCLVRAEGV
ncbi:hypothetical protein [Micromonospora sp. DT31]|uniref:hypothetical protein n=1 Tax=Micromonospora sp. DT31 TaxID=3393434 RepID=UPI003CF11ECD